MTIQISTQAGEQNAAPGFSGSPGGVTRVTIGSSTERPAALPGNGTTAADYSRVQRVSASDLGPQGQGDILSSARSNVSGRALAPSEITPDTMVTVQGVQMRAAVAERMGLLARDPSGYRGTASAAAAEAPRKAEEATTGEPQGTSAPALSSDAAASLEALNAGGDDTVRAATEILDTGDLSTSTLARLAGRLGVEPGQVQQHIASVSEGFRNQAAALVGGSEVLDLAAHLDPTLADRAARDHALRGDVSGYAALAAKATEHVISNAASVESVDADIRVRTVSGKHLVSGAGIPGEVDLRQAVRMGLVSVTVQR